MGRQTEQTGAPLARLDAPVLVRSSRRVGLFAGCFSRRAHDDDADDHSRVQVAIRAGPASDRGHRRGHDRPPLHHATAAALLHAHSRCVKNKADVAGCRSPTGRLAEGGRSLGQPGAFFYSGMWEAAAQWLRPLRPPTYLASEISGRPPASASLGQPRPIGRDVRTGRPRRLCSPPRYWGQSDSFGEIPLVKLLKLPFTHLSVSVQRLFLAGAGVGCAPLLDWLLAPAAAPPTK